MSRWQFGTGNVESFRPQLAFAQILGAKLNEKKKILRLPQKKLSLKTNKKKIFYVCKIYFVDWILEPLVSCSAFVGSCSNSITFAWSSASLNLNRAQFGQSTAWTPGKGDENILIFSNGWSGVFVIIIWWKPALRSFSITLARSSLFACFCQ